MPVGNSNDNSYGDTANRINGFERPKPNEGYALENDISNDSIHDSSKKVNKENEKNKILFHDREEVADVDSTEYKINTSTLLDGKIQSGNTMFMDRESIHFD